jgi:hypothetical protein
VERHAAYIEAIRPLFQAADRGELELVTSELTLLEVVVVPCRAGDLATAERYEALLTRGRRLRLVEIGRAELRTTARLRD